MQVIIDTDPGIDDAIAILYALRNPALDVLALTTLGGNVGLSVTTRNAGRIVTLAGVPTPVHPGANAPLGREAKSETAIHGNDGLGGVDFPEPLVAPSEETAVQAMARLLRDAPEKTIDLHCLGPLTNMALLAEQAPDAASRIRRVIAMGGVIHEKGNMGPRAEFNIAHDPDAAARVLAAGLDITLIPLDATRQFRADAAYLESLRATGRPAAIGTADLIDAYFTQTEHQAKGSESRPLHDPCVPLLACHEDLFRIEEMDLSVELETGALDPGTHPVRVAMGLDAEALRARLRDGLAG